MDVQTFLSWGLIVGTVIGTVLVPAMIRKCDDVKKLTAGWKLLATIGATLGGFAAGMFFGGLFGGILYVFIDTLCRLF